MTPAIRFRPEAEDEIAEAVDWYEARGRGLGAAFLRSVEAAIASLRRNPEMYATVLRDARRAVLRRFPYSLIYVPSASEILIVACIHGRRHPARWQRRV